MRHPIGRCGCGETHATVGDATNAAVNGALLDGLFPDPVQRRGPLRAVGAATLLAALADMLPVRTLHALAQEPGALEKNS
jgi:nitrate/nitrite transport system substrate-binding protein